MCEKPKDRLPQSLAEAVLTYADAEEHEQVALDRLCQRLGIPDFFDREAKWASVGRLLAFREPEFSIRKKRGRPRLAPEETSDALAYKMHEKLKRSHAERGESEPWTQRQTVEWLNRAAESGIVESLFHADFQTRVSQISRGKKLLGCAKND
ncbi:hypothetical protein [Prosthecomicrobium hirschii]|uniref:hypothetical protein n=1 Tax=Prosthecodimorpha hirschii TaxID=665126 RepID=UPI00221FB93E|nr:hypothetical protein [Prosthecomicrobium hirschii]MCW1841769.1 hypothetical protein [Prosthecomicrobium hirschii]